jgi:hypothetical protein
MKHRGEPLKSLKLLFRGRRKTKETAFQILNRTIWTNKKAYKSWRRDNPNCDNFDQTQTIEHLIYGWEEYSSDLWTELGQSLAHVITAHTRKAIPTIQFTPLEIIYNKIHPSVKLHIKEEIKRDIIYRRMNTYANQRERNLTRICAHLLSSIRKTISLLEYQGTKNHQESLNFLTLLENSINDRV